MQNIVIPFPNASRQASVRSPGDYAGVVVADFKSTLRPLDSTELTLLSLLATVLVERGTLAGTVRRIGSHLAALGRDADPAVMAGLRLAVDGLAMLHAARRAVDRNAAREKTALLADLPVSGDGHVAIALCACVEADRRALRMRRSDLA